MFYLLKTAVLIVALMPVVAELAARRALLYHTDMSDLIMPVAGFFDACFACSRSMKLIYTPKPSTSSLFCKLSVKKDHNYD